jgi:hypothetical protein
MSEAEGALRRISELCLTVERQSSNTVFHTEQQLIYDDHLETNIGFNTMLK